MPGRRHSLASANGYRLIKDNLGGCVCRDGQLFWVGGRERRAEAGLVVTVVDDMAVGRLLGD